MTPVNSLKTASAERNTFAMMGIAALLIVNSHMEPLYPRSFMAADGLMGNLIFFVLSGFGIAVGQRKQPSRLGAFYGRRICRIYPSLWIVIVLGHFAGTAWIDWGKPTNLLSGFIWPTGYGFIAQIMLFYPVLWWLARCPEKIASGLTWAAAALWTGLWLWLLRSPSSSNLSLGQLPTGLWWAFYFLGSCTGAAMARSGSSLSSRQVAIGGGGLMVAYLLLKFELALRIFSTPSSVSSTLIAGMLQLFALAVVVCLVRKIESLNVFLSWMHLKRPLEWIGKISLQLYLVHIVVLGWVKDLPLLWPVRLVLVFALSLALSAGLLWLVSRRWVMRLKS